MVLIRVEYIGGIQAYGITNKRYPALAWDLRVKWRFDGLAGPGKKWKHMEDVMGWLYQHVSSSYRRPEEKQWTAYDNDYWEMWTVVYVRGDYTYAAVPYKDVTGFEYGPPPSVFHNYFNDAYTIGQSRLRALGEDVIYKQIGMVYFVPFSSTRVGDEIETWYDSSLPDCNGPAGVLHWKRKGGPGCLPAHGLRRVEAIHYQVEHRQNLPDVHRVTKWEGLQRPSVPYYETF